MMGEDKTRTKMHRQFLFHILVFFWEKIPSALFPLYFCTSNEMLKLCGNWVPEPPRLAASTSADTLKMS
jgi:hypothetical protein